MVASTNSTSSPLLSKPSPLDRNFLEEHFLKNKVQMLSPQTTNKV